MTDRRQQCLVTGGAGFIGSHLVAELVKRGHSVRVYDDFSTGQQENLKGLDGSIEIVRGDVVDSDTLQHAMKGIDLVFHLAALASVQFSVENPSRSHEVCATGTLKVLDAARKSGVRRLVYAASSSAYGLPTSNIQDENTSLSPLSPYAAAKLAGEHYCMAFSQSFGLETVRLRFFNIYGPRQRADSPYSGVIALFAAALQSGKTPTIFGDGNQTRDFAHVSDVVQALLLASSKPNLSGEVFNIGTGEGSSLLQLMASLNRILGTNISPRHDNPRQGDVRHSRANIQKAREKLGYNPIVSLETGLKNTLGLTD
ncbi:MAG: SDR family oxidoreductase [Gemmataceae bacterium]